ncbi:hypothetical protein [Kocuria rhizophila]|uniref:hypothetical protein n=1 Tax=Kocuria rhizophila TaxID=72000 RepID=UPI0011A601F8|nr:hypothetical protein [Kocuria rhizophila]
MDNTNTQSPKALTHEHLGRVAQFWWHDGDGDAATATGRIQGITFIADQLPGSYRFGGAVEVHALQSHVEVKLKGLPAVIEPDSWALRDES